MGIDVTWYSHVTPLHGLSDDAAEEMGGTRFCANDDFPGREAPLVGGWHTFQNHGDVLTMGYISYTHWRNWLAKIAGWPSKADPFSSNEASHCVDCWDGAQGPFAELINFSDCEGTLGATVCSKLAKDFAEFDAKAAASGTGYYYEIYKRFRHATETAAATRGAIRFH